MSEEATSPIRFPAPALWRELGADLPVDDADNDATYARYREMYALACELVESRAHDPDARRLKVHCGAVLIALACDLGELDKAQHWFGDVLAGGASIEDDSLVRECLARAGRALVFALGDAGADAAASGVSNGLVALAARWPEDRTVGLELAEAAAGLAVDAERRGDCARITEILAMLSGIAARYRGDPLFARALGRAVLCQLGALIERGDDRAAVRLARIYSAVLSSEDFARHLHAEFESDAERWLGLVATLLRDASV